VLVDSLRKRITFLANLTEDLGLTGVTLRHARAEDAGRDPELRDRHDLVVARAVAALPTLLEWCGPLVRPAGAAFVALKTPAVEDELARSGAAARALRLRLAGDVVLEIPAPVAPTRGPAEPPLARRLLVWEKQGATPPAFPRRAAEIAAKPL
jgi:16S rRNA (guanine527-N7)-methyltransferase